MPLPLLLFPAAAGAGWLLGKYYESAAAEILKEVESERQISIKRLSETQSKYETIRRDYILRIRSFITQISLATRSIRIGDVPTDTPSWLQKIWVKLDGMNYIHRPFSSYSNFSGTALAQDPLRGVSQGISMANAGHPGAGAMAIAGSLSKKANEYHTKCKAYQESARKAFAQAETEAKALLTSLEKEKSDIERSWDTIITPQLNKALESGDNETMQLLHKLSNMLVEKLEKFSDVT